MERDPKHRKKGGLDLFSAFMFESSGDSEGDFSGDVQFSNYHHHYYYDNRYTNPMGPADRAADNDDDAESCVLGSSRSSETKESGHGRARRRLDDDKLDASCISDEDSVGNYDHCRDRHRDGDREEESCISDDSIRKDRSRRSRHRRRRKLIREEEDKLFWKACLAS